MTREIVMIVKGMTLDALAVCIRYILLVEDFKINIVLKRIIIYIAIQWPALNSNNLKYRIRPKLKFTAVKSHGK